MYTLQTRSISATHGYRVPGRSEIPVFDGVALGRRFRERREELGVAQDDLALAVGVSRVQLQNIEAGLSDRAKRKPLNTQLLTLVALCRELEGRLTIDVNRPEGFVIEFDERSGHRA